jgi:hypothetical protein
VSRVVNIDLGNLPTTQWLSALDASGLPLSMQTASTQDIAMSGAISALRQRPVAPQLGGIGTGPIAAGLAGPRPRVESVSFPVAPVGYAPAAKRLGRAATNHNSTNHNSIAKQYATSVNVLGGVGTSGPPRRHKPA